MTYLREIVRMLQQATPKQQERLYYLIRGYFGSHHTQR